MTQFRVTKHYRPPASEAGDVSQHASSGTISFDASVRTRLKPVSTPCGVLSTGAGEHIQMIYNQCSYSLSKSHAAGPANAGRIPVVSDPPPTSGLHADRTSCQRS